MVPNPYTLLARRLCSPDIEVFEDLAGIGRDDLAVQQLGEPQGHIGLPRSGGSDENKNSMHAETIDVTSSTMSQLIQPSELRILLTVPPFLSNQRNKLESFHFTPVKGVSPPRADDQRLDVQIADRDHQPAAVGQLLQQ